MKTVAEVGDWLARHGFERWIQVFADNEIDGEGSASEEIVVGETPNLAARLQGIDEGYEQAARDLYAGRGQAFFLVLLPQAARRSLPPLDRRHHHRRARQPGRPDADHPARLRRRASGGPPRHRPARRCGFHH